MLEISQISGAIMRLNSGGVNSAFIIAAWIADVWVNPVKSSLTRA
jgi:hypothetical protein